MALGIGVLGLQRGGKGPDDVVLLLLGGEIEAEGEPGHQQRQNKENGGPEGGHGQQHGQKVAQRGAAQQTGDHADSHLTEGDKKGRPVLQVIEKGHEHSVEAHGADDIEDAGNQHGGEGDGAGNAAHGMIDHARRRHGQVQVGGVEQELAGGRVEDVIKALAVLGGDDLQRGGKEDNGHSGLRSQQQDHGQNADKGHINGTVVPDIEGQTPTENAQHR